MTDLILRTSYAEFVGMCEKPYQFSGEPMTPSEALTAAKEGNVAIAGTATDILSRIEEQSTARDRLLPVRVVAGGTRVDVPAYLGGNPRCMVRRAKRESVVRHVNLYVSIVHSAGISPSKALTRGCAVLGLLETLQAMQVAVNLHLVCDLGGGTYDNLIYCIEVDSNPLDLGRSAFAIAHSSFARSVAFGVAYGHHGWRGGWAADRLRMREVLNLDPSDVYIESSHINEVCGNPAQWIEKQVSQVLAVAQ